MKAKFFRRVNEVKPECISELCGELIAYDKSGNRIPHPNTFLNNTSCWNVKACKYSCQLKKYKCGGRKGVGRGHINLKWDPIESHNFNSIW